MSSAATLNRDWRSCGWRRAKSIPADAAIRRVLDDAEDPHVGSRLLAPYVEIALAAGDVAEARVAADELADIAAELNAPFLRALSTHATGDGAACRGRRCVLPRASLRQACTAWREARRAVRARGARVLMGLACRRLGDEDTAKMELDAGVAGFEQLVPRPISAPFQEGVGGSQPTSHAGGLSAREVEVLALVATGKTNRAIVLRTNRSARSRWYTPRA